MSGYRLLYGIISWINFYTLGRSKALVTVIAGSRKVSNNHI